MMVSFAGFIVTVLILVTDSQSTGPAANIPYAWRNIEFQYPTDSDRANDIQSGNYIPQNVVLNDLDVWPGAKN